MWLCGYMLPAGQNRPPGSPGGLGPTDLDPLALTPDPLTLTPDPLTLTLTF
jgi:hypothetical protein